MTTPALAGVIVGMLLGMAVVAVAHWWRNR